MFITFDGIDGSGKTTQAQLLAEALRARGGSAVLTAEPGGTDAAIVMRNLLLDPRIEMTPDAQALLHFAARFDHVAKVIQPALDRGDWVVCDRFYDSTVAYQGYGLGASMRVLTDLVRATPRPDITFVMDQRAAVAQEWIAARGEMSDRYECFGAETFRKIASGFLTIALADPGRCMLVDAGWSPTAAHWHIMTVVRRIEEIGLQEWQSLRRS